MTNIYIKYNPYSVESEFKVNDVLINSERILKQKNKRLQFWLQDNNRNWNGIVEELVRYINESEFNIIFEGRKIDFEDLKLEVERHSNKYNITLEHKTSINDLDIIDEIDNIFESVKIGPIEELRSKEIIDTYEEIKSSKFKINVIATMSSGKSTLINSLLGFELLPSKNEACTATIGRITNNINIDTFIATTKDEKEEIVHNERAVTLDDIIQFNEDENVTYIDIEGPIPSISSDKMDLVLLDTPGPNNSRNKKHGELTETIINDKDKSVVLYVINARQFGINDDSELLTLISDAMKRGGKQSKDRFIFAINQCDSFDCEKEESIRGLLSNVTEYLAQYGIEDPNLFPVSAQMAKVIRMKQNNIELTRRERNFFNGYIDFIELDGYHFDKMSSLSQSSRNKLMERLKVAIDNEDELEEALIHTGIPAIEEAINEYLEKYAYPIKVDNALKSFLSIINEKNMLSKIEEGIANDSEKYEQLRHQIEEVKQKVDIGENAKTITDKIDNFKIDDRKLNTIERDVERVLERLTRTYQYKTQIEKMYVDRELATFKREVEAIQKKYQFELKREINNSIVEQGEKLVEEYENYISQMSSQIKIKGFKFTDISAINASNINEVDDLIHKYSEKKEYFVDRRVKNPDKKWWNWNTWDMPAYIDVKQKVSEKELVNVTALVHEYMGTVKNDIYYNIDVARDKAKEEIELLKDYFKNELGKLDEIIKSIISNIDIMTSNQDEIIKRVEENKELNNWLKDIVQKVNKIMSF